MYELQLFDDAINQYVPVETGDDPRNLMDMAQGMARRVINAFRGLPEYSPRFGRNYAKPLPLKPRVLHGMSGKPRKYKPDTMIEPASVGHLADRALAYYTERANKGETNIPVFVWANSQFEAILWRDLGPYPEVYRFVRLNPEDYL